ncbi:MAG: hypothetical protein ACK49G_12725, partial [Brevundimonas sp.]|uniref:hypothetical protein n=1 Tax=Brevundimonas sp. TaxID=1871086 RepID=UPI00391A8CB1
MIHSAGAIPARLRNRAARKAGRPGARAARPSGGGRAGLLVRAGPPPAARPGRDQRRRNPLAHPARALDRPAAARPAAAAGS